VRRGGHHIAHVADWERRAPAGEEPFAAFIADVEVAEAQPSARAQVADRAN
jgi:hypothetical protein